MSSIQRVDNQLAITSAVGDIRDNVLITAQVFAFRQGAVEYIELALHFHSETVDGIGHFVGSVGIKVPETATRVRRAAQLPEHPRQIFRSSRWFREQQVPKHVCQIHHNGSGLEDPRGIQCAWI